MIYGGSKLKSPKKCDFYGIFYNINEVIKGCQLKKLFDVVRTFEVLQTTLGGNPTCSFRDI